MNNRFSRLLTKVPINKRNNDVIDVKSFSVINNKLITIVE